MANKINLLIIDPQVDFCSPTGALSVPGADKDMERLSNFVKRVGGKLNDIHVTLDCHRSIDIAHKIFWRDSSGQHPNPYTIITKDDVQSGKWTTTMPSQHKKALNYVKELEANDRYPLCIWPAHCLIGSEGNTVYPELFQALLDWEEKEFAMVDYVTKGSNPYTEHYSAVKADVADPNDPSTHINTKLIDTLMEADILLLSGEAGSHCLANTVFDIAEAAGDDFVRKFVLLTDATSPVPTFDHLQKDFIDKMVGKGMQLSTTTDFLS